MPWPVFQTRLADKTQKNSNLPPARASRHLAPHRPPFSIMSSPSSLALDHPPKPRLTSAFTLIEILVVLGIIALLTGVLMTDVGRSFGRAQGNVAKLFVTSEVEIPLTSYRVDIGDYPSAD